MTSSTATPYETLVEMIEQELVLAGEARFEELIALGNERAQFVATLPPRPPAGARDALERASLMQKRLTIELLRGREQLVLALAGLEQARRAARGYAPPRLRAPRLSASA